MTPQEKAKELFKRFDRCNEAIGSFITPFQVKQCALIAVDEIIKYQPFDIYTIEQCENVNIYWQQVKKEIENL